MSASILKFDLGQIALLGDPLIELRRPFLRFGVCHTLILVDGI